MLVNSNNISFIKADNALLDLMNYMFRLNDQNRPINEFKISNFLSCYRHFWTSTLLYESGTFITRTLVFDYLKKDLGISAAGFLSGVIA